MSLIPPDTSTGDVYVIYYQIEGYITEETHVTTHSEYHSTTYIF